MATAGMGAAVRQPRRQNACADPEVAVLRHRRNAAHCRWDVEEIRRLDRQLCSRKRAVKKHEVAASQTSLIGLAKLPR